MCFDFTKMAPEIKVQTFLFFGGHVFSVIFWASSGKFGQVWGKFGQKWCLKCFALKKCAQNGMKCSHFFEVIFFGVFFGQV